MRRSEEMPLDPEVLAELEVIDQTLRGEPVDPEYAELAELALLLAGERGTPSVEHARALDVRAERRFARAPAPGSSAPGRVRRWFTSPRLGGAVGVLAALAVGVVLVSNSGSGISASSTTSSGSAALQARSSASGASSGTNSGGSANAGISSAPATASHAAQKSASAATGSSSLSSSAANSSGSSAANSSSSSAASSSSSSAANSSAEFGSGGVPATVPTPNTSGRKVVQSAQLTLSSSSARIDTVSQEVFNVVAQESGIVKSSQVTSAPGKNGSGTASFNLSIPTANLETTLQDLSALQYAHVVSRTDATQDVTDTYRSDQHQLQDAQALRTSLLKQLENATTQIEIDSLKAQLRDAETQINADQSTLNDLQRRISYSNLEVQLYGGYVPVPVTTHSAKGFTLSRALHDAGRVLVVAAGVILIALAVMVPIGLVIALGLWISYWLRQRRREQALDQG